MTRSSSSSIPIPRDLPPPAVSYASDVVFGKDHGGKTAAGELGLPVRQSGLVLPCGSTGRWEP